MDAFEARGHKHPCGRPVVVFCFGCWQGLANRSMRIQDLYVGAFLIPRFISLFFKSYARAHVSVYPHTPTRISAAGGRP